MADLLRFKHQSEPIQWRDAWAEVERIMEASSSAAEEWDWARPLIARMVYGLGFRDEMQTYAERALEAVACCYILRGGLTAATGSWLMTPFRQAQNNVLTARRRPVTL